MSQHLNKALKLVEFRRYSTFMKRLFTDRERDILVLLASGKTSKEIANALGLSIETVASYRKEICRKLSAHSTAELVSRAANLLGYGSRNAAD